MAGFRGKKQFDYDDDDEKGSIPPREPTAKDLAILSSLWPEITSDERLKLLWYQLRDGLPTPPPPPPPPPQLEEPLLFQLETEEGERMRFQATVSGSTLIHRKRPPAPLVPVSEADEDPAPPSPSSPPASRLVPAMRRHLPNEIE